MFMRKMKHEFHASFANGLWMFMANSSVCPLLLEKPGFLAMRLDCWDFVPDLQPTQEEGIGQVHIGLHESSGRVQSYQKNMTIFQFETSPTNCQRVGKSWQVQQKWCQRHPVKLPEGHALWPKKMSVQLNLAPELHRSYRVISMLINILIYTWYHMIFQNFLTTGWDFSLPCLVMFNYWRCFYYIKIPGFPSKDRNVSVWWWSWRGFPI